MVREPESKENKVNNWAKPSRVEKKKEKDAKTYIQHLADKERAFSAASRRGDRKGIEGRMKSAQQASAVHKLRTGRALKITEDIVLGDQMYEEEASPTAIFRSSHQISMHHPALPAITYDGLAQHLRDNPAIRDNLVTLINLSRGQPVEEPIDPKMTMEMSLYIQTTQSLPSLQRLAEQLSHEQICTKDLARQLLTSQYHYQQLEYQFQQLERRLAEQSSDQSFSRGFNEPPMSQFYLAAAGQNMAEDAKKLRGAQEQAVPTGLCGMTTPPQNMPTPSLSRTSSFQQGMSSPSLNQTPGNEQLMTPMSREESQQSNQSNTSVKSPAGSTNQSQTASPLAFQPQSIPQPRQVRRPSQRDLYRNAPDHSISQMASTSHMNISSQMPQAETHSLGHFESTPFRPLAQDRVTHAVKFDTSLAQNGDGRFIQLGNANLEAVKNPEDVVFNDWLDFGNSENGYYNSENNY